MRKAVEVKRFVDTPLPKHYVLVHNLGKTVAKRHGIFHFRHVPPLRLIHCHQPCLCPKKGEASLVICDIIQSFFHIAPFQGLIVIVIVVVTYLKRLRQSKPSLSDGR